MCGGLIAWCDFSWEAFATLFTGLAAVCAALVLGLRQAAIQENQVNLQSLSLRSDLFDRRFGVYARTRDMLADIFRSADVPSRELSHDFHVARIESRFLFEPNVISGLDEIWKKIAEFGALKSIMKHTYDVEGHYGDGNPEREGKALMWFSERLESLPVLFHELHLSELPAGKEPQN